MNKEKVLAQIKKYPVALACMAVSLLMGVLVYLDLNTIPDLENQVSLAEEQLGMIERNDRRAVDIQLQLERIREYIADIDSRLLVREEKATNYQIFYEIEQRTGARLTNLFQEDAAKEGSAQVPEEKPRLTLYDPITYRLSADGSFEQLARLFNQLRSARALLRVDRIEFSTADSTTVPGALKVQVVLDALGKK